jgi:hypothetical protein
LVNGACSSTPDKPLGGDNPFGGTSSTAGTPGTAGTSVFPQAGMTSSTAGTPGTAGTGFGTAGTFGSAGTFSSAGTDTGGATTGGTGGTGGAPATGGGGSDAGGASGGTPGGDFPANCPAPTGTHGATPLTKTCWKGSATDCSNSANNAGLQNPPAKALDADLLTRFSTGAKITSDTMYKFDIDMGKAVMINGVSSNTPAPAAAGGINDIPPMIEIDVSTDGTTWKPVACGTNALMADISFAPVSARYVRFAAHGSADAWWSIVDVNVYAAGADTTCGADAGTPGCTSIGAANAATCCGTVHTL